MYGNINCNDINKYVLHELIKIKIKTHYNKENNQLLMTKEQLIQFCIDLIKTIEKCS